MDGFLLDYRKDFDLSFKKDFLKFCYIYRSVRGNLMLFKRKKVKETENLNIQNKINELCLRGQGLNLDEVLKDYVESYLFVLHHQNEDILKDLSGDELVSYMIMNLELPIWLQYYLKSKPGLAILKISDRIEKGLINPEELNQKLEIFAKDADVLTDNKCESKEKIDAEDKEMYKCYTSFVEHCNLLANENHVTIDDLALLAFLLDSKSFC